MNLTIKKMSPELAKDYFDFFDNRAFSDNSPFYPCYCNAFQMTKAQLEKVFKEGKENGDDAEAFRIALRKSAVQMVEQNIIQGYLAYDGDISMGWCNANNRKNYTRVGEFNLDEVSDEVMDAVAPLSESMAFAQEGDLSSEQAENEEKIKSIVCFEIAPEYRGRGIATALLNRVCEDAVQAGFVRISQHGNDLIMQKKLK